MTTLFPRSMLPHSVQFTALAALAGGCGGPDPTSGPNTDESDIPLAAITQEVFTLGGAAAAGWQQFGELVEVHFDGAGNLVVVDRLQPRVAVAGPDGALRHFVSRAGEGPGEFRLIGQVGVLRDNRLVVSDLGHNAFLLFDADGAFMKQIALGERPAPASLGPGTTMVTTPNIVGTLPDARLLTVSHASRTLAIHTLGEDRSELYRAYRPPVRTTGAGVSTRIQGLEVALGPLPVSNPFAAPFQAAVLTDGRVAVADSVGYQVKIMGDDGVVDAVLGRPINPAPVTEAMRDAARERDAAGQGTRIMVTGPNMSRSDADALSANLLAAMASQVDVDATDVPVIKELAVDSEDRLWITRTAADGLSNGPVDVITADGTYLGTLDADEMRVPDAFGPGGLMAYIEPDELDVVTIRVVRLVSLQPGA